MDLDQGGNGTQGTKVWLGPSLGWAMQQVQPTVTITTGGTYVVKPGDSLILVDFDGAVSIQLPDVRTWIQQSANQPATAFERDVSVKDVGGFAEAHNISISPFGSQEIDGLSQPVLLDQAKGIVRFSPLYDLSGWIIESATGGGGGGGGGGDVFKAGNNIFTGINQFLNTIEVPTMPLADISLNAASTAFVKGQGYLTSSALVPYAPLDSPTFINVPRAPTPPPGDNDTKIATTAFVQGELGNFQPLDADLTAISALTGSNTIYYRSGTSVWSPVTIGANLTFTGGTLSATGGGGGAPTDAEYITSSVHAGLSAERVLTNTASITWDFSTPGQAKASTATGGGNVSNSGTPTAGQYAKWVTATTIQGVAPATVLSDIGAQPAGSYQPLDATLTALAAYATVGLMVMTAADTFTGRSLAAPAAGLTITNPAGTAGNPTFALANDLAALEALSGTNTIYYRSAADTWSPVTFSGLTFSGGVLTATAGGGNVSNSGTPTVGQWARWTDATHIEGIAAASTGFVLKTGDTMTGFLEIKPPAVGSVLHLTKPTATDVCQLVGNKGSTATPRWAVQLGTNEAETGSNAGSNFNIARFNDAGSLLDAPISIDRATGATYFSPGPVTINNNAAITGITEKLVAHSAGGNGISVNDWSGNTSQPSMTFRKSRGVTPGTHGAVQVGDSLGTIFFKGDDGTNFVDGARIATITDSGPISAHIKTSIGFFTDNGTAIAQRMVLSNTGGLLIFPSAAATGLTLYDTGGVINTTLYNQSTGLTLVTSGSTMGFSVYAAGSKLAEFLPTGCEFKGATNASTAPSGFVGEVLSQNVTINGIGNATVNAISTVTLTPGDWDIWGVFLVNSGPGSGQVWFSIGTTPGGTTNLAGYSVTNYILTNGWCGATVGPNRVGVASNTPWYTNCYNISGGTLNCEATIYARRRR